MIPVCIFAKPPECGKVKTRLISRLGENGACSLAAAMFQDVWDVVNACSGVRPVLATPMEGTFPVAIEREHVWLQVGACLGARLENIFRRGLDGAGAAIAIGADSPSLTTGHLEVAVHALDQHDAVIGRSLDGGFYLLGVHQCEDGLLAELPWSTCETAEATIARLKAHGRTVHELVPLFDVDVPDDLELLAAYLGTNPQAAPATRAWAKNNGLFKDGE
jgi:rSAM/selenodomain-associated transferase 1